MRDRGPLLSLPANSNQIVSLSLERLFELIELAPIALVLLDAVDDGGMRVVSEGLAAILGYSREELAAKRLRGMLHPEEKGISEYVKQLRSGEREHFQAECRYRHRDGHYVWLLISAAMLRDAAGRPLYVLGHLADITQGKRDAEQLRHSAQLQRTLTSNLPNTTVALIDRDLRVLAVEGDGARMRAHQTALGQPVDEVEHLAPEQRANLVAQIRHALAGERREYQAEWNGSAFHTTVSPLRDDAAEPYAVVLVSRNITTEYQARQQLQRLARFDSLTGLPNRDAFRERIDHALRGAHGSGPTLLFLDVDNFKQVNDSLGHDSGDELLRRVADRVRACVRETDEVFRLSGDEFTVLLEGGCTLEGAGGVEPVAAVAQRILEAIALPMVVAGHELFPSASMGIADACEATRDGIELLKAADMAMYAAKRDGRNTFRFFQASMAAAAEERLRLSSDLHRAIQRDELVLHYLPQFELASGRLVSVEALVRWRHPDRGLVPPGDFIAVAEETGLIMPIGAWVLQQACRQLAVWRAAGHADLRVAVNVSAVQLAIGDLTGTVMASLQAAELPGSALELEITESALMDADRAEPILRSLRRMGVRLAIDDFGTGYSSLARLRALPIDTLKIDRSFVADVPGSPDAAALVRTIIALAGSLGISTLAEGVETVDQRDYLSAQGCAMAAGWLWSKALPAGELTAQLERRAEMLSRT